MTRALSRPSRLAAVRIRKHATAVLLAGSLVALAGCSSGSEASPSESSPTATPSASPSSTADPEEEAASRAILADYRRYWDEKEQAYAHASLDGTELNKYAVGTAFATTKQDLKALKSSGQIAQGKVRLSPEIRTMDLTRKVPSATVRDCVDITGWKLVNASTRKEIELPKERLTRYVSIVKAEKWGDRWVVLSTTREANKC